MKQTLHVSLIVCIALMLSCAGITPDPFVQRNLVTFQHFTLANGIPVCIKHEPHTRIRSVVLAIRGGKASVPPKLAGLDSVTLRLMKMESRNYTDIERRTLLKQTSATISGRNDLDCTLYYMKCIDTYFSEVFDLYADLVLNPVFPEELFIEIKTNMKNAYLSDLTDGYARVSFAVNMQFFRGHPYEAYLHDSESLGAITLADVRRYYRRQYAASRMVICAVGDFDIRSLRSCLEATFGTIRTGEAGPSAPSAFSKRREPLLVLDAYEDLKGKVSYVRGNFSIPPVTHNDYWPLALGLNIVSDIMADVIRTKNGKAYSVWAHPYSMKANYANISVYRTNDPAGVAGLIHESVSIAASGRCLSPFSERPEGYTPIADALDYYKTAFFTRFYSGLETTTALALKMADAWIHTGDYTDYLYVMKRIDDVTAEDVQRVLSEFVKQNSIIWAVTAPPDVIAALQENPVPYAPACKTVTLR